MKTPETLLCHYVYDALDRLTGLVPSEQEQVQRFYNSEHLATELQGQTSRTVFQQGTQLLALQQRQGDEVDSQLLATDQQRSVLHAIDGVQHRYKVYSPYGHRRAESGLSSLLGFNGERPDPVTGHYLLGNGHRAFNPVLMRFNSPDRLSPFGRGGLNPYAYCLGDPVNRSDPSGQESVESWVFLGLGVIGLLASVVGAFPSIGFVEAAKSLKKGVVTRRAVAKVTGTTIGIVAGTVSVGRLALNIADPDSEDSKTLLYVGAALGVLSLLGAGGATFLSWRASRGVKAKTTTVFTQTSNSSSSRGSSLVQRSPRESLTPGLYDPSAPPLTPGIDLNQYDWMNPETQAALNNLGGGSQSSRYTTPRNSVTDIRRT
ncbi:MAG: RHS repeat-associated core domain-containing protein [Pseudomonas sp.]|nr:RHS repeat-associated core domain-containing protein [Pseudomonas sp.]